MIHEDVGSRGGIFGWIKSGILPIRLKLETHQVKTFSYQFIARLIMVSIFNNAVILSLIS